MIWDLLTSHITKGFIALFAWAYYQASELTGGIVDEAFDRMFSLGLLVLLLLVLGWEYLRDRAYNREVIRRLAAYNEKRDSKIEQMVEKSAEADKELATQLKLLRIEIRKLNEK